MNLSFRLGLFLLLITMMEMPSIEAAATPTDALQPTDKVGSICFRAAQKQERLRAIPGYLLQAMALAESGRWDDRKGENIAWPWTVTAGGKGAFFTTKAEAVAFVEELQKQGVRNIDVGCMQVNLMYHPDAFASLGAAFTPDANAAYAAKLLVRRQKNTTSWLQAAGNYHSTTRAFNHKYKIKVARLWNDIRARAVGKMSAEGKKSTPRRPAGEGMAPGEPGILPPSAMQADAAASPIDRTRALNAAFRDRNNTGDALLNRAAEHRRELDAWRQSKVRAIAAEHQALMNRVRREQRELGILRGETAAPRKDVFAERRREQLRKWREKL
ncbi:lysozyme family protein [Varunaivibrio sulfuroxidans]|uniref:Transglycosylase-like protein with SLT domain n=1 Tax=Varunaivibrio sulfuroxidans TaxID=1773489 RepID=A0A4V2UN76_9PROT|nr:hypothetical protein [Varunaivibrio sulfuroxidans]TCS60931.1 hypothetical protein EDD55_10991 [Varunaivibrio sulfuroxidans]WES31661.1 hypothetical protein P3M64_04630 [Varunaivibrio sulfuroxidans]